MVVHFSDGGWAHVEVKIGDRDLAKTPDTTRALQKEVDGECKRTYLLLPSEDIPYWDEVKKSVDGAESIETRTWLDVAKALRASVLETRAEPLRWRVWAATFLGAVEQQRLGFPQVRTGDIEQGR